MGELDRLQRVYLINKRKSLTKKLKLLKTLKLEKQKQIIRRETAAAQAEVQNVKARIALAKQRSPTESAQIRARNEKIRRITNAVGRQTISTGKGLIRILDGLTGIKPKKK